MPASSRARTSATMLGSRAQARAPPWRLGGVCGYGWRCFSNRRSTSSTATIVSTSSIPITSIGIPTTYIAVVPTARRRMLGRLGICIQARWGRPAANIKHRPVTKRPNAIHLGSIAKPHRVWPPRQALLSLRRAPAGGNEVGVRRSGAGLVMTAIDIQRPGSAARRAR